MEENKLAAESRSASRQGNVFLNRNFRLTFFGALVSELGATLYSFAVSFYILEISGNNAFLQGLYLALCGVALLLFTPVGGVLGDRYNKAKIMSVCDYLKGGVIILATILMLLFREPGAQIVILFIMGISGNAVSGLFIPAANSLFPDIVAEEKLQQANSYFSMKTALENILGIILAGILYATISIYPLFFLIGACFIASGISEMLIRYNHRPPQERLTLRLAVLDLKEGIDYLKAKKVLRVLLGTVLFFNFFNTPLMGNFPPFFVKTDLAGAPSYLFDRILTPELWSSVFNVFFGISSLLGGAILSTRAQKEKCGRQLAIHLTMFASVMIILTLCYWNFVARGASLNAFLITLCVGYFAIGLLVSYINIPTVTAMMRIVDKDKLSKMASLVNIGGMGMTPIASVLAGTILETRGCTPLLAVCSAGLLVTALLLLASPQSKEF